jgi:hypothetical protein
MAGKMLVTGYIPIQGHPRTAKEYGDLGENLFSGLAGDFTIHPFYETVGETWLAKLIQSLPQPIAEGLSHSTADNAAKNSLAYHCVQHQKFAWLLKAAISHPSNDVFVWMDYGIGHVPGVTPDVVNDFMAGVKQNDFAIPGCWDRAGLLINDYFPCWRFCGGLMVVPRDKVHKLYKTIKREVAVHIHKTNNITWEVNSLAHAEPNLPPIRWYKADHNETLFTNYAEGAPCEPKS